MLTFYVLLLGSLLLGTLTGISIKPGVIVYAHDIMLLSGIVFLSIRQWQTGKKKQRVPSLLKPIALFVSIGVVSLLANVSTYAPLDLFTSSLYLWRWAAYAYLYVMLVRSNIPVTTLLGYLFSFGLAFGIVGILQFFLYPNLRFLMYLGWDPHYYRLFSTLLDPNYAGIILVLSVFLGYHLYITQKKHRILAGVMLLVLCVYLTYSRSSYLALGFGMIVYGLLKKQFAVLGLLFALIAIIVYVPRPGGDTLRLWREDSTYSRFSNWQESSALFLKSPIFGHGFNTLRLIQTPKYTGGVIYTSHAAGGVDSSILFLLVTSGVLGLFAYVYLLFRAGRFTAHRKKEAGTVRQLYIVSMSAVFMHSFFVNSLFYPWVMIWVWVLVSSVELTYDR